MPYGFSVIDATKFSNWHKQEVEFHLFNRIAKGTVYPTGMSFLKKTVKDPVDEAVKPGKDNLYADAWYDVNDVIEVMFKKGYTPIVCPHKERWKGYYRKKARKL